MAEAPPPPELHIEFVYTPLEGRAVRWYSYRAAYNGRELSKAPEVPHRGSLLRFCAADSAALEGAYRQRQDDLERCWWEEEAALQKGDSSSDLPSGGGGGASGALPQLNSTDWGYFMAECAGEEAGVGVRSGAFEVDLARRQLHPCYWPGTCHRVLRGTWFAEKGGEWVPLKESLAEQLEEGYRQAIWLPTRGRLQALGAAAGGGGGGGGGWGGGYAARLELTTHVERGLYALFVSEGEVFLCQETGWGWLRRIGASSTAGQQRLRLRRGYEQPSSRALLEREADLRGEELDEGCAASPVSRLVLLVHGVGQKLEAADIAQDASSFRSVLRQVAQDQSQQGMLDELAGAGRTEVLPVQWRKHLHIEADTLSRQLMPPGIPSLRQVLHSTVVEILLFMTPQHRADIVGSLVASLNATYARFKCRNPSFEGSVSILSHSLGSVLCYDILCSQPLSPAAVDGAAMLPRSQPPSPGSAANPMLLSPPASPQRQQQQHPGTPGRAGQPPRADAMQVDLIAAADSLTSALQQELSRLRAENQRLHLQLDVARGEGGSTRGSSGGDGTPLGQQQWPAGVGSAGPSPAAAAAGGSPLSPPQQGACVEAAGAGWPPLQFSVDQLILLGSPLGCFLALRGVHPARGLAPGLPLSPDGLPAVRRLTNVYHPYDPVAHRLEPLAQAAAAVQRAAFVPLFRGGKRIHLAVQEFSEDMGSAASKFGSTLLASLAFSKFKGSSSFAQQQLEQQPGGLQGGGEAGPSAAAAAAEAVIAAAEEEEEAARQLTANKSLPALGASAENSFLADATASEAALRFGVLPVAGASAGLAAPHGCGTLSAEASDAALSPLRQQRLQEQHQPYQQPGALSPRAGAQQGGHQRQASAAGGGIARVADGPASAGGKTAQGRLDFVMQESSLENQYLSALSAHFGYWTSPDVALFVLRAVHGMDVLTGTSKDQRPPPAAMAAAPVSPRHPAAGPLPQATQQGAAGGAASKGGHRGRSGEVEPTSPRQHLISLP